LRILLTGATGFLGSHLLEKLLDDHHEVVILKRTTSDAWRIRHRLDQVTSYNVDVEPIEAAFADQKIDAVVHTACHYGRNQDSMSQVINSNLMFGVKVLDMTIKYNAATFINTGTFFSAGSLLSDYLITYSLSKKQFVEWLKQSSNKIRAVNLKLEHMYGPKDDKSKFVPWLVDKMINGNDVINLTSGEQIRDFIYINDVVAAYVMLLKQADELPAYSEYEVGTAQPITVRHFVETLSDTVEKEKNISVKPRLNFGAVSSRQGEIMHSQANIISLAKLGWKVTTTLEEGLKSIIANEAVK